MFGFFSDFPDDIDSFTIDVFNGAKRAKPVPLCRTTLLLERLPNGVVVDQWYQLIALTSQGRGEMGSIRTRAQFLQETLMPLEEYNSLQEVQTTFLVSVFFFFFLFLLNSDSGSDKKYVLIIGHTSSVGTFRTQLKVRGITCLVYKFTGWQCHGRAVKSTGFKHWCLISRVWVSDPGRDTSYIQLGR